MLCGRYVEFCPKMLGDPSGSVLSVGGRRQQGRKFAMTRSEVVATRVKF